jgi:hypothetical protein
MNVAFPDARVPVPNVVGPSRNVTVPVIVPAVAEVTVAVNVTFAPTVDGLNDVATAVVVFDLAEFTCCVNPGEVLGAKVASPPYCAVIACAPAVNAEVDSVAAPPAPTLPVPIEVTPSVSKNVTVPVIVPAVADVTVAVSVTLAPNVDGFKDDVTAVDVAAKLGGTAANLFSSKLLPTITSCVPSFFILTATAP